MINAFAINDSRLVRIDEDQTDLNTAIWLDLLEPTGEEREILQEGLGQSLASFLELKILKLPPVSLKMKMVYTCTHFFIAKTKTIMLI